MSTPGNPFEGIFGELAKLFSSQGPVNLQVARQIAQGMAMEGAAEPNIQPLERIRYEELGRAADLQVSTATGLSTSVAGGVLEIHPVGRGDYAGRTLDAYRPLFEGLAQSFGRMARQGEDEPDDAPDDDPTAQLLGGVTDMIGPVLLGLQAGSLVGHQARQAMGQYDLPIPRPSSDQLLVVPDGVNAFASDWSLDPDEVRMWVCLHQITHHAVIGRPHVSERLTGLLREYVSGFQPDPSALEDRLSGIDPTNPATFNEVLGNPGELLGVMQTPAQRQLLSRIEALVVAIEGYVDHVLSTTGGHMVGSAPALIEAMRRRRADAGEGGRLVEQLFGLELGPAQYERGTAFVRGVLERAGDEGLARLWRSERELPTPAEVDAPGLWLERIDIPD
ncbi:MAG TPA: zinc-dependent metalloprotease [Acidimicrobiales bacterium]|nr:zinc-dependent metalloprotease [Acidimicrobiales bacterium]